MADSTICKRCGMPKDSASTDLVSRLVDVCCCSGDEETDSAEYNICVNCKRIIGSRRAGSLTQFIFGKEQCNCDRPNAVSNQSTAKFKTVAFEGFVDDGKNEVELDLDPEKFPIDRYKAISILGRGSAGLIYLCRDRHLRKRVAIKTLHALTADQLISFQEEARATSKLNHPNIVGILDFGATKSGIPYMVMEFVPGVSLQQLLERTGTLDSETAVKIVSKICEGLQHAHAHQVYHRDLKPGNILVSETEGALEVKIIDFGVAKVKESSGSTTDLQGQTVAGTPGYMPPDMVLVGRYDARSEIYSVACILFELLAGKPPLIGETALETIALHANVPAPSLYQTTGKQFPESLENTLARCLDKEQNKRFQSMEELRNVLDGTNLTSTPMASEVPTIRTLRSGLVPLTAAMVAVILTVTSIALIRNESKAPSTSTETTHRKKRSNSKAAYDNHMGMGRNQTGQSDTLLWQSYIDGAKGSYATGNYAMTQVRLENALRIVDDRHLDRKHLETTLDELGGTLRTVSKFGQAEKVYRRLLSVNEQSYGQYHPKVARCLYNLGDCLKELDKYREAEPFYRRASQIWQNQGMNQDAAVCLERLSTCCKMRKDYRQAEELIDRAEKLAKNLQDDWLNSYLMLSRVTIYQFQGRYHAAEPLLTRAVAIREKLEEKDYLAEALKVQGFNNELLGRYKQAEQQYRRSFSILLAKGDPTTEIAQHLARLYEAQGKLQKAREVLTNQVKLLGSDHSGVSRVLEKLGDISLREKKFEEAEVFYKRCVAISDSHSEVSAQDEKRYLLKCAQTCLKSNRAKEALQYQTRADLIEIAK